MDGKSLNITAERIQQLQAIFPEVFTEGKVDFKRLQDVLGSHIVFQNEHYELSWAGKAEARKQIQLQTTATIAPDKESSIDFDNSENIFIEGENLEVLRVLQKSYFGKVKMIYIDPPYNTGNDSFVYPDDYSETQSEYKKRTGMADEDGFLNKQDLWKKNTKESGQFHSVWLSMMYPRLYLSRNLMREDGVIFVSIDDNEQANLKLLMDEIFGAENFVEQIIWKKRYGGGAKEKYLVNLHEYILMYAKNKDALNPIFISNNDEFIDKYYTKRDSKFKKRGPYRTQPLEAAKSMGERKNLVYEIPSPNGESILPKRQWLWSKTRALEALKNEELEFNQDKSGNWTINIKQYLRDEDGNEKTLKVASIIENLYTQHGSKEIEDIFTNVNYFPYPKPTGVIKLLSKFTTGNNDIILDFFAGSGTSAQAVLDLNKEANSNRKFILVQLPEKIDDKSEAYKAGYKTIADITKTRIQKVIFKLKAEQEKKAPAEEANQALGFQAYKLVPSNFKQWHSDVQGKEDILKQLEMFTESLKPEAQTQNMLTELLVKSGKSLTTKLETHSSAEGNFYFLPQYNTCICLSGFGSDTREELQKLNPKEVMALNTLFTSDEFLSNTKLEFGEAGIRFTLI